ncbi:DUF21 domain-containing protein [Halobacteriovorax sp. HLS]|uniref:DUF21 domain-containing protein n=1 Tax=Halobacteriovorax sp. HLS TaxID=2234000 RepID=UPI000FD8AC3E|nr:DUF21 domain-containing protein [Halobacteriovorax sp. HLS]
MSENLTWIAIFCCVVLSGIFSGLNIGLFGLARLRLESEADAGNIMAQNVLKMRQDSNFLLTTLLWGNVSVNTLLALLTESVFSGLGAFIFTTFIITFFGEIIPQAWFSRNALQIGSALRPLIKLFQFFLYPLAKPTALLLDRWLGKEGLHFFSEETLKILLEKHIESADSDIEKFEGVGALNFLSMDDLSITEEGEDIHPDSIIKIDTNLDLPSIPDQSEEGFDTFFSKIVHCPVKWAIFVDKDNFPVLVLNTDAYIKSYYSKNLHDKFQYCHRPIVFKSNEAKVADIAYQFKVDSEHDEDDVIDYDVVILWSEYHRKVITGSDILGRLFRGIVHNSPSYKI